MPRQKHNYHNRIVWRRKSWLYRFMFTPKEEIQDSHKDPKWHIALIIPNGIINRLSLEMALSKTHVNKRPKTDNYWHSNRWGFLIVEHIYLNANVMISWWALLSHFMVEVKMSFISTSNYTWARGSINLLIVQHFFWHALWPHRAHGELWITSISSLWKVHSGTQKIKA